MTRFPLRFRPLTLGMMLITLAAGVAAGGCQSATADVPAAQRRVAYDLPQTDGPALIAVRSDAFADGGNIPDQFSAYHQNISPPLEWSGVPDAARSLVLLVEDPDAPPPLTPFVHWALYNLFPGEERLQNNVPVGPRPGTAAGAVQGKTSADTVGYFGPKPPRGDEPHHYHFQVFALDRRLDLSPGATRADLLRVMDGRVVGKGRLVGTYYER